MREEADDDISLLERDCVDIVVDLEESLYRCWTELLLNKLIFTLAVEKTKEKKGASLIYLKTTAGNATIIVLAIEEP